MATQTRRRAPGRPLPRRSVASWTMWASLALSLVAVAIAAYLTITHYADPAALACPDHGVINCTLVTTSSYSVVFGIPVAVLGLVWAATMTALCLPAAWRSQAGWIDTTRLAAALVGAAMVLYLIYVELFDVGAICLWCSAIHLVTIALLAVILIGRIESPPPERQGAK